jgi:hypothetical protein
MRVRRVRAVVVAMALLSALAATPRAPAATVEPPPERLPAPPPAESPAEAPAESRPVCGLPPTAIAPYPGMAAGQLLERFGAASCATGSCHGGPVAGNHDVQSFAATIWSAEDRHARAYEVLHSARSQRMARLLGIGPAQRAARCLACHSVQDASLEPLPREVLADGVACAACHGDAGGWLHVHTSPAWRRMSPEARAALGYRDLSTPLDRVQTCVRCHVGDADHEVDHELIAAGHPRLFFEFAAYQRLEPRHWSPAGKAESTRDFTARSWAVGQAVVLEAAAELLVARAERGAAAVETGQPHRWPEFAEFDCYSCHRSLSPHGAAAALAPAQTPSPGRPSWQPWQVAGARLLRAGLEGAAPIAASPLATLETSVVDLRRLLDADFARDDRERLGRILMEAHGLAEAARRGVAEVENRPVVSLDAAHATLDEIVARDAVGWRSWDSAVQTYLALEAARSAGPAAVGVWHRATRHGGRPEPAAAGAAALDTLRDTLRFPPDCDSPGPFDPQSFLRARRQVP